MIYNSSSVIIRSFVLNPLNLLIIKFKLQIELLLKCLYDMFNGTFIRETIHVYEEMQNEISEIIYDFTSILRWQTSATVKRLENYLIALLIWYLLPEKYKLISFCLVITSYFFFFN